MCQALFDSPEAVAAVFSQARNRWGETQGVDSRDGCSATPEASPRAQDLEHRTPKTSVPPASKANKPAVQQRRPSPTHGSPPHHGSAVKQHSPLHNASRSFVHRRSPQRASPLGEKPSRRQQTGMGAEGDSTKSVRQDKKNAAMVRHQRKAAEAAVRQRIKVESTLEALVLHLQSNSLKPWDLMMSLDDDLSGSIDAAECGL